MGWNVLLLNLILTNLASCEILCPSSCLKCETLDEIGSISATCSASQLTEVPNLMEDIINLVSLDLSENDFAVVPSGLPSTVIKLDLSYNKINKLAGKWHLNLYNVEELLLDHNFISLIGKTDFGKSEDDDKEAMPFLRKLGLSHNRIRMIQEDSFRCIPSLRAVTLSHNELLQVTSAMFTGLEILEFIDLSHNHISVVQEGSFKHLSSLKYVYLSWNQITTYPTEIPMLEWLDLSHNEIQRIAEEKKEYVYPVEVLNIAHNPLICDCATLWLKELYDRREYILKYINIPLSEFIPSCAAPSKLAGESWDVLGDDVFQCVGHEKYDTTHRVEDIIKDSDKINHESENKKVKKRKRNEQDVNVIVSLNNVLSQSVIVTWILDDPNKMCQNVYIQYYQVGNKETTTMITPVPSSVRWYKVQYLEPDVQYNVCVLPAIVRDVVPSTIISSHQCVQFVTDSEQGGKNNEKADSKHIDWKFPDLQMMTEYSKLIGFSFLVSVLITGTCLFFYEIGAFCYEFFVHKKEQGSVKTNLKAHTD